MPAGSIDKSLAVTSQPFRDKEKPAALKGYHPDQGYRTADHLRLNA